MAIRTRNVSMVLLLVCSCAYGSPPSTPQSMAELANWLTEAARQKLGAHPAGLTPDGHELARLFFKPLAEPGQVFPEAMTPEIAAGRNEPGRVGSLMSNRVSLLGGYGERDIGDPPDWFHAPDHDAQWPTHLSRHYWLFPLAYAWRADQNEAAAAKAIAILLDWIRNTPIGTESLQWGNARSLCPDRHPATPEGFFPGYVDGPWTSLSAHARIEHWSVLFALLWDSPHMTNEAVATFLVSLARDHRLCMLNHPRRMNQFQGIAVSLIHMDWWYPFLAGSSEAGEVGRHRLFQYAEQEIYPDGSMAECSPNYGIRCLLRMYRMALALRARNADLPGFLPERLADGARYFAFISDPAGNTPRIAKGGGPALPVISEMNMTLHDPELAYVVSQGREGKPPALSHLYSWAGHVTARSSWLPDADWIFFEPGPRGNGHHDRARLNIQVQARGAWLLTDPGFYSYSNTGEAGEMARYLASTAAHNAALVDGHGQISRRPGPWTAGINENPGDYGWSDDGSVVRARGTYDYGFGADGAVRVVHRRDLVYNRERRTIVIHDRFDGEGHHHIAAHWQFAPSATVTVGPDSLRAENGPAQAVMSFLSEIPIEVERVIGRKDPPGGWYSRHYGHLEPAPMGVVTASGELPIVLRTLIELR